SPRGHLRWNVDDGLLVGDQSHRDVLADALASLDRPGPLRPLLGVAEQGSIALRVGVETTPAEDGLVGGHHLDRDRPLVRVHADHDTAFSCAHLVPPVARTWLVVEPGGQRCLELGKPLLSLSWPWRRPTRAGQMRATRPAWAAEMRATNR